MFGGTVIHGDGEGKKLGYPTANLDCVRREVKVGEGIYAARVHMSRAEYPGALVVQDDPWKVEVHLLDYDGDHDLYGYYLDVDPIQKVGPLEDYDTMEELRQKITNDIVLVRDVFRDLAKKEEGDI